jgi:PEP-CTERM motif
MSLSFRSILPALTMRCSVVGLVALFSSLFPLSGARAVILLDSTQYLSADYDVSSHPGPYTQIVVFFGLISATEPNLGIDLSAFDSTNSYLGSTAFPGINVPTNAYGGIEVSTSDGIGHITLHPTVGSISLTDDLRVWGVNATDCCLSPTEGFALTDITIAAVPEPSTWAMMLLGFTGLGFMAYRRKSKPALMAA